MSLKDIINRNKKKTSETNSIPDFFFKEALMRADNKVEYKRTPTEEYKFVHVSSLDEFCARRAALLAKLKRNQVANLTGGHKITFAQGRAIESHVLNSLFDEIGRKNFMGTWSCKCGHTQHVGLWDDRQCTRCNGKLENYKEYTLRAPDLCLLGNPDIFMFKNGVLHIGEIKSMNKEQFNTLEKPLSGHIRQATKYYHIAKHLKYKVSSVIHFIYVMKEFKYGVPYKTYTIDANDDLYKDLYQEAIEEIQPFKNFLETGELPPRILCDSKMSGMAKTCNVCNECFSDTGTNSTGN
jgi:hypothetical protein